jgi:hypothetical protein
MRTMRSVVMSLAVLAGSLPAIAQAKWAVTKT